MSALVFFGSDQYSATVLDQLMVNGQWSIVNIVTDQKPESNPVEKLAKQHNLKVFYYPPNPAEMSNFINNLLFAIDHRSSTIGLCASFDHLLPAEVITIFEGRLYNLHPSLLPQYRNVAPVPYALAMGDTVTGITLQRIDAKIDHGEIVAQVEEPILDSDTSPLLLHRLFAKGAEMFLSYEPCNPINNYKVRNFATPEPLIFTHRLTPASGFLEWPILLKLITNQPLCTSSATAPEKCLQTQSSLGDPDTTNPLIQLRLTHFPTRQDNILHDLVRGLSGWERVWTVTPTTKGEVRLTIESVLPNLTVKLAGKPKAITWPDFTKYYL